MTSLLVKQIRALVTFSGMLKPNCDDKPIGATNFMHGLFLQSDMSISVQCATLSLSFLLLL